jgi:hypothetical protein
VDRRLPNPLLLAGINLLILFMPSWAQAAPKDAAASKLDNDAIYTDYLGMQFGNAEKKLKQAITQCGKNACSPKVVAVLHRDLGTVFVVEKKNEDAKAQFVEALKADPSITLLKDLTTPEIQAVWNAAKAGGPAPAPAAPEPAAPAGPAPSAPAAGGDDIVHTPIPEQAILTPVPVYAELPDGMTPAKVQLRYKVFGATDWKTLDLKKLKQGYGAEIPCLEVGSTTGDLKYFIQAIDSNGDVLATSGTRNAPHKVPIKSELSGDPPHLPGKAPPAQCANPTDCPPGLPGCTSSKGAKKHGDKGAGATCEEDAECESGTCRTGACAAGAAPEEVPEAKKCTSSSDCDSNQTCNAGVCAFAAKKNWITVGLQQDALFLNSASSACLTQDQYSCYWSDNSWYNPSSDPTATDGYPPRPGKEGEVVGGFGLATTRVLVGYDRMIIPNVGIGVRLGYAFNGGPQKVTAAGTKGSAFLPFHAEARASYWFGNPGGIRPYLVVAGGMAQVDAKVTVNVYLKQPSSSDCGDADPCTFAAWKKAGTTFVAGGVGILYPVGSGGVIGEVKLQELIGSAATGAAMTLGYAQGF